MSNLVKTINEIVLLILAILLITTAFALADAAPDPLNKGIRPHRRTSKVQMTTERVDILLGEKRCEVTATFLFTNPSKQTETMEVGFPSSYPGEIRDAVVTIADRLVKTRNSTETDIVTEDFDGQPVEKKFDTHWLLWDMEFAAGQTREVTVSYWVKPFDNKDYVSTPYTRYRTLIRDEFAKNRWDVVPEVKRVLEAIDSRTTGYVLMTGAGWNDVIGEAVITARHPDRGIDGVRWYSTDYAVKADVHGLTWTLKDFEPDADIFVEFNPDISLAGEIKLAEAALAVRPESQGLQEYLAYLRILAEKSGN